MVRDAKSKSRFQPDGCYDATTRVSAEDCVLSFMRVEIGSPVALKS